MTYRDMQRRLATLEAALTPEIVGISDTREDGTGALVGTCGTEEVPAVDVWKARYPGSLLITIEYESDGGGGR